MFIFRNKFVVGFTLDKKFWIERKVYDELVAVALQMKVEREIQIINFLWK